MAEAAPRPALSNAEVMALVLALEAHLALVAGLVFLKPVDSPAPLPERMTVTISDEVGLTATSPEPDADPAQEKGPELGDTPPLPEPQAQASPEPQPKPIPVPPKPAPAPKVATKPPVKPTPPPVAKPVPQQARTATPPKQPPKTNGKPGSSAFDNAFADGIPRGKSAGTSQNAPAPITGAVRSSLAASIARQLKPKWRGRAPTGLDAEKLVTILTWDLNPDGTLAGSPRVVRQEGITPANRAQAARHAEEAIRAVRLVGRFDLPPQYYSAWKHIAEFKFDRSLGQ